MTKNRIKAIALAGLLSAACIVPLGSAQAHDVDRWERRHARHYHKYHKPKYSAKQHRLYHKAKKYRRHADYHRAMTRYHRKMAHKHRHKKIVVHKRGPNKVVYVYKKYDDDYKDKLLAASIAQTALILALD